MLIHAATLVLGPVLIAQARRLRATALELPEAEGPRAGVEGEGGAALRLLVVGDSSAAGVGARTQDEALARPLARHVAHSLRRSVSWQLIARSGLTSAQALELLRETPPASADFAVAMLGVNDVTHRVSIARALRQRGELAQWLRRHAGVRQVVFCALPPMQKFPALPQPLAWYAGAQVARVNRAQARWALRQAGVIHAAMADLARADLFAEDGFHPGPVLYGLIARRLAHRVAELAADGPPASN
ncbi:MAG: SGNH/GDSL hydrolase family protein [Burkholderiaceae bacterium]